jgi:hypothetical protein
MNQPISERVRWTTADLELFPDNGNRFDTLRAEATEILRTKKNSEESKV